MVDFTYEFKDNSAVLEKYEWDNVWWECMDNVTYPRVLYIGDSISCGTRRFATEISEGKILFDGLGTSKAVDNPHFKDTVRLFAKQQYNRCAILFNNGLHGWHLSDKTEYKEHYVAIVNFLLEEFKETPLFLVLTSAVEDKERNERVKVRNQVVLEIAEKYRLPVIDFYTITDNHRECFTEDGVHLYEIGYRLLAKEAVEKVKSII